MGRSASTQEPSAPDFGPRILEALRQLIGVVEQRLPQPQETRVEASLGDEEPIGEDAHSEPPEHDTPRRERSRSPSVHHER
ncbi:hypothetical protein KI387_006489, partial [Taxus chinensis]